MMYRYSMMVSEFKYLEKLVQQTVEDALKPLAIQAPLTLSEWAAEHFYLSKESSYVAQSWTAVPWQIAIMNCISNDDIIVINFEKSARVGATKIMLAATCYFAHHCFRNQIFYQPTDKNAEDFCKTDIDTTFRDIPAMYDVFPSLGRKSPNNTNNLKMFKGSVLRILGGAAAGNYRRYSADVVYYDELESFTNDVQGEGSPVKLGDTRFEGSLFKKSIRMTTPRLRIGSIIHAEVEASDHLFRFKVHCPHCGVSQVLKWGDEKSSFGFKWVDDNPSTVMYLCENNECGCLIHNNDLTQMNEHGFWECERTGVIIDHEGLFVDSNGVHIDTPSNVSFHIWTAYSPFTRWSTFTSEFIIAVKELNDKGDVSKLKTFVNTTLGETWSEKKDDGDEMDFKILYNRREHYPVEGFPARGLVLMGGFDMQDDRVEGEITACGLSGEKWLVDYFIHRGDPSQDKFWIELHHRVLKTYRRCDGVDLGIERICFDSGGHFTKEVYNFSKMVGVNLVIPTKGASVYTGPLCQYPKTRNNSGVYLTIINTHSAKEILYKRLKLEMVDVDTPVPGLYHFPISDKFEKQYFRQLCAESVKVLKKHAGRMMELYDAGSRRNEPVDTAVGVIAALSLSIDEYNLDLDYLEHKRLNPKLNSETENNWAESAVKLRQ